jgi:hypothetical protein
MIMATIKRVVMYYLLLELKHDNGHNKESSNLLLTTGGHCHDLAPVVSSKLLLSLLWPLS